MDRNWKPRIQTNQHLVKVDTPKLILISTQHLLFGNMLYFYHLNNLLFEVGHPADVLSIEATVHVEKATIVNCQLQLPGLLATTIQEDVAALETNIQGETHLGHTKGGDLFFFIG